MSLLLAVTAMTTWAQSTAYVSSYAELSAAISNASVNNIVVTANIDVPCGTSVTSTSNPNDSGSATAQLVIGRSLTLQSQAGSRYMIKRISASGQTSNILKSIFSIRGSGKYETGGEANLTENTVEVTFTNIIIDGGADWKGSTVDERRSAAADAYGNSGRAMIDIFLGGTLNLEDGVVLQNGYTTYSINSVVNNSGSSNYGGAVRVEYHANYGGGTINVKAGATIHDCTARTGYGGGLGAYNFARLNLYGGTIYNCSAAYGGAIGCTWRANSDHKKSGTVRMYGGTIRDCCADNGGAISMDGEVANYLLGGAIDNCSASSKGDAICIREEGTTVNMVAYTSHLLTITNCMGGTSTSTENTGGYEGVYKNENATIADYPVYHVTFRNNNTVFAVLSAPQGTSLGEAFPAAPVMAGLRFLGWYNGNTQVTGSTSITDNITVTAKWDFYGSGTDADPYQIPSAEAWNFLADNVNNGNTYSEKVFQMTNNISVTTMAGVGTTDGNYKSFNGTFDGNGHTLNVAFSGSGAWTASFGSLNGATIKNLHITGSISTSGYRPGSIAGFISGNSTITNCWSEVAISSSQVNKWVDAGAFVARINSGNTLTLNGCLFTGSITYTDENAYEGGGMVGWAQNNTTVKFYDCVFAPSAISITNYKDQYTFAATYDGYATKTIDNCYYNDVANLQGMTKEGKHWHSITADTDVTLSGMGSATASYNVSGITAYAQGIKYNNVYYAGNGDAVSLNLSHADKPGYTFSLYTVTGGGTLANPTTNSPTLTMTNANQTINAEWLENTATLSQATDNSTFISTNNGLVYDITLTRTLQKGGWNTFCVPFTISSEQITSVFGEGTKVRELGSSDFDDTTKALTLNFTETTSILAGKPYLVYLGSGSNVVNPTFEDVTIVSGTTTTETTYANFMPVMNPTSLTGGDKSILFVTGGDKLTYPSSTGNINGFRAYFQLHDLPNEARSFAMNFDDETTALTLVNSEQRRVNSEVYDLQGRKVAQPIKGLYIVNGKKFIIK